MLQLFEPERLLFDQMSLSDREALDAFLRPAAVERGGFFGPRLSPSHARVVPVPARAL